MQDGYGRQLRLGRLRLGLTQQQLASRTGVAVATIRDLEQGRSTAPREETVKALAAVVATPSPARTAVTGIDVLGPLRVWRGAGAAAIGHGGHRVVLARLALTPHEAVHRDELVALLWTGPPPASAVNMVQAHVSRIRRLLRGRDGTSGPVSVSLCVGGYQLELPAEAHDGIRFARLAEAEPARTSQLEAALGLWRGRPVEDVGELAEHPAAAGWERRRLEAAARFARLAHQDGDAPRVVSKLRRLMEAYPLDADLVRRLIETLVAEQQPAAARQVYQDFMNRLAAHAAAAPNPAWLDAVNRLLERPAGPALSIRVLGPVEVVGNGRPVPVSRSQRRGVLALLAMRAPNVVSALEIVEALWGGQPPATATSQVHSAIAALRKTLASAGLGDVVESTPGGYRLLCPPDNIDVHVFEDLIERAHRARSAGDHAIAGELVGRAAELWQGMPLGAASGFFVEAQRARLELARLTCLEDLADSQLRQGPPAGLTGRLRQLAAEHPDREGLQLLLMRALQADGRTLEALETARAYRRHLAEEFGLDPGSALVELERALLRGDTGTPGPDPEPAPPAVQPAGGIVPAELPRLSHHLVGREDQLCQLNAVLASLEDKPATIVVAGPAGVGKTQLANAWCHEIKDRFPDGQIFVTLNTFHDVAGVSSEQALEAMLRSLGVPPDRIPGPLAQRAALWRSLTTGKHLLVLIDDAAGSEQVRPLLPGDGGAVTVVTSRRRLSGLVARDDAVLVPLGPLTAAQSRALLSALLPAGTPVDIGAVATHCAGLPLALRIAAARLRLATASAANVVSLLEGEATRLSALSIDDSAVRAELMSSYEALSPQAAAMLRALASHPGSRPSVAVCAAMTARDIGETRESLDQLAEAHLADETGDDRYQLHDLVRLFARERLADNEEDELVHRAVGWYVHAGHLAGGKLRPAWLAFGLDVPAPDPATLPAMPGIDDAAAWLDAEIANIEALIRGCRRRGWHGALWRLAHAPMPLLGMRRSTGAWMGLLELGLAAAHHEGHEEAEAFFHNALGIGAAFSRQYVLAEKHFGGALRLAQRRGDTAAVTGCRLNLAGLHGDMGKAALAVRELTAIAEQERAGDGRFLGPALNVLCDNLLRQDRHADCARYSREAFEVATARGDVASAAHAQSTLADALSALDSVEDATAAYLAALHLAGQVGDARLQARTRRGFGDLLAATGRDELAVAQWKKALALFDSLDSDEAEPVRRRLAEPS